VLQEDAAIEIDICICTFHRISIEKTLCSIAQQDFNLSNVRVIIADNAAVCVIGPWIAELAERLQLNIVLIHAPERNISIARNACLDASTAPLIAFIDDDEWAERTWLSNLVRRLQETQAAAVFGPVLGVYPADAPAWFANSGLHETRPTIVSGGDIPTGYTCNALFRADVVNGLRFMPELGRSGGEDTVFFNALYRQGRRFAFAADAVVREDIPHERLTLKWLTRRAFRAGQTHGRLLSINSSLRPTDAILASSKIGYSLAYAALNALSPAKWRRGLMRAALHAGVVMRVLGLREVENY